MKTEIMVQAQRANDTEAQWFHLDLANDNKITLQYVSNILSDVSKITTSHSMTVKLPRTAHNDEVLDLAVVPQYESRARYKYLPCRVIVNGIDVTGDAFLYLTDSEGDIYSCVVIFGLMQKFREWLDSGKGLKDLQGAQYINWDECAAFHWVEPPPTPLQPPIVHAAKWFGSDANINTYTPANGLGKLMYFGAYNPGFERDNTTVQYANVHPFVTVREILERIISENSLNFDIPSTASLDMEDLAVVLTKRSGNTSQGNATSDVSIGSGDKPYSNKKSSSTAEWFWNVICQNNGDCYSNGITNYNAGTRKSRILFKGDSSLDLRVEMELADSSSFSYGGSNHSASYILNDKGHLSYMNLCVYVYSTRETLTLTPTYSSNTLIWSGTFHIDCWNSYSDGDAVADIWIENDSRICNDIGNNIWNLYWFGGSRAAWDSLFSWTRCVVTVDWYDGTHEFPNPAFRCFPNMPDISQVDFVKFVCQLYGLFPVVDQTNTERVEFVPFDILIDSIYKAYDWSGRLLEESKDAPNKIAFRIGDFAQRNIVAWKEDDKDPVYNKTRTGILRVNDLTLDKEKEMLTFPFAASEGDLISQYTIKEETDDSDPPVITYTAEFTECQPRIMRVVQWEEKQETNIVLNFQNLKPSQIIGQYYASYQAAIENPIIITEHIRLNEVEIRDVDFRIPVYLGKYGRYYAIKNIKWTTDDSFAEVELLQIQ